jgi:hypothetical protein
MTKTSGLAFSGVVLGSFLSVSAWAFPAAPVDSKAPSSIILAAEGCGGGNHRNEHNRCVRDDHDHCGGGRHWHEGHGRCEK